MSDINSGKRVSKETRGQGGQTGRQGSLRALPRRVSKPQAESWAGEVQRSYLTPAKFNPEQKAGRSTARAWGCGVIRCTWNL